MSKRTWDGTVSHARALNTAKPIDNKQVEFGKLTVAALNVLDLQNLSDKQRHIADQVYDLCNQLEETV